MSEKLRILEVNKFYFPHIGGIETVIQQRAEYLSKRPDVEVKVLVCQEKGKGCTEIIDGTEITRASSIGTYFSCPLSVEFLWKFRQMAKWADVIEFHTPFPLGDLALLLSGYKGRVVIAWHSDVIKQKKLLRYYKPLLTRFLQRADAIIAATPGHIDSSSFLPEYREKCHIIPYGLDAKPYQNAEIFPILTRQCGNEGFVKFLFVGRLVYYKGADILLDA
ncbi:MAG: glycosyltransferase, partial [Oscillospiraceae bacterium]|nr:glycosyltransferase [Oscillospiraceae bacterium]